MTEGRGPTAVASAPDSGALAVFKNRPFLFLWLAQAFTQIGGNMVIFGLTIIIAGSTNSTTAVSALILTFLVPAVLFSALAGVFVDRLDKRLVLIVTNVLRGVAFIGIFFVGDNLVGIYLLNIFVSTVTVFFGPAEAAMIPQVVPRRQLLAANGIFTLTLNAAFALGFALLGPLVVKIAGAPALILVVAVTYFIAAALCVTLPDSPPVETPVPEGGHAMTEGEAVRSVFSQLREGLSYIKDHKEIRWSLIYLGTTASLVGVLGVLGPSFAEFTLGLGPEDFVVVVLPLGIGVVMGILILNAYGRLFPRRRVIEGSLVMLGVLLAAIASSGQISNFIARAGEATGLPDISAVTSLLSLVVGFAFFAGITYAFVAIPSQTQLQEDLPEDVRGRVFGVLNMLVSVASFLPILIVGPIADLVGTTVVMLIVGLFVSLSGLASVLIRGPLKPAETALRADVHGRDPIATALGADLPERAYDDEEDEDGTGPLETVAAAGPFAADRAVSAGQADPDADGADAPSDSPTDAPLER
ncbi:MAG TPA: MFS transporter [Candidatus Limnocylindrales bacterium]|nr:MFS transporter [Candidatus Limnocylindrales bacterium]